MEVAPLFCCLHCAFNSFTYIVAVSCASIVLHPAKYFDIYGCEMTSVRHASGCLWTFVPLGCTVYDARHSNRSTALTYYPYLNKQTKQVGMQMGLGSCSMHKWMKSNVWRIKNVKRVSVKPEQKHREFFEIFQKYLMKYFMKYFTPKKSWNFTSLVRTQHQKCSCLSVF